MSRGVLTAIAIAALAGCGDAMPARPEIPVAPSSPAPPPPNTYAVSGTVFRTVGGMTSPLAGRTVWFWVHQQTSPTSGRGSSQSATTDASGRYLGYVPESRVFVSAWNRGEMQPCLASTDVRDHTTVDVYVGPADNASGLNRLLDAKPVVTGTVYEVTAEGRRPLPRAALWLDASIDAYVGYTESDDAGRFVFCRVNAPIRLDAYKDGFQPAWRTIPGTGDMTLDIELKPSTP